MATGFDLGRFIANPTHDSIDLCRKADLISMANYYGIDVNPGALKGDLKLVVLQGLVDNGVLAGPILGLVGALPDGDANGEGGTPPTLGVLAGPVVGLVGALPDGDANGEGETPPTSPKPEPMLFSPGTESLDAAKLKLRMARLDIEREENRENRAAADKENRENRAAAERAQRLANEHQLALRKLELEFELEKALKLRQLELQSAPTVVAPSTSSIFYLPPSTAATTAPPGFHPSTTSTSRGPVTSTTSPAPPGNYDLFRHIELPPFRETEVDAYFHTFERLATVLNWPKENWSTLLQCKLTGKAQHVIASLPLADSLDYDVCKTAVLRAYERVPEAYRQQFRNFKKDPSQTFVEFARVKRELFDKWCSASQVTDLATMRELILLEEFKKCAPERCVVHLNEKKVSQLNEAAIFADEYMLTHKEVFGAPRGKGPGASGARPPNSASPSGTKEERECYYCHAKGHVQKDCYRLNRLTPPMLNQLVLLEQCLSSKPQTALFVPVMMALSPSRLRAWCP